MLTRLLILLGAALGLCVVLALLLVLVLSTVLVTKPDSVTALISDAGQRFAGLEITIAELALENTGQQADASQPHQLHFKNLEIRNPAWPEPVLLKLASLRLGFTLSAFTRNGRWSLDASDGAVFYQQDDQGRFNWLTDSLRASSQDPEHQDPEHKTAEAEREAALPSDFSFQQVGLNNIRLHWQQPGQPAGDITVERLRLQRLGKGELELVAELQYQGQPLTLHQQMDVIQPHQGVLKFGFTAKHPELDLQGQGRLTLQNPLGSEVNLDARLSGVKQLNTLLARHDAQLPLLPPSSLQLKLGEKDRRHLATMHLKIGDNHLQGELLSSRNLRHHHLKLHSGQLDIPALLAQFQTLEEDGPAPLPQNPEGDKVSGAALTEKAGPAPADGSVHPANPASSATDNTAVAGVAPSSETAPSIEGATEQPATGDDPAASHYSAASPRNGSKKASGKKASHPLLSQQPLPWQQLDQAPASLHLELENIHLGNKHIRRASLKPALKDRRLRLDNGRIELADGLIIANLLLDASGDTPSAQLHLQSDSQNYGDFGLQQLAGIGGGRGAIRIDLKAQGLSPAALAANLHGQLDLQIQGLQSRAGALDLIGSDLLSKLVDRLNPLKEKREITEIECAALHLSGKGGVFAEEQAIAVETPETKILGSGEINFAKEKLQFSISPIARKGVGVNISSNVASLVRLGGSFGKPEIEVDPGGLLNSGLSTGAAIYTGGLSLLAEGLIKRALHAGSACDQPLPAIAEVSLQPLAQQGTAAAAANTTADTPTAEKPTSESLPAIKQAGEAASANNSEAGAEAQTSQAQATSAAAQTP